MSNDERQTKCTCGPELCGQVLFEHSCPVHSPSLINRRFPPFPSRETHASHDPVNDLPFAAGPWTPITSSSPPPEDVELLFIARYQDVRLGHIMSKAAVARNGGGIAGGIYPGGGSVRAYTHYAIINRNIEPQ